MKRLQSLLAPGLLLVLMGVGAPAPALAQESGCVRRHVPNPDTLNQMTSRYASSDIKTISTDQFQSLPAGPDIPDYDQHQGGFDLAMWQIYSGNANQCSQFGLGQGALIQASGGTEVDVIASSALPPAPWCARRHVPDTGTLQTITSHYPTAATGADISTYAFQNMLVGRPIPEATAANFWSEVGNIYDQASVGAACAQSGLSIGQLIQAGGEIDVVDQAGWNTGVACLRQATPPAPPTGGAVLAVRLDPNALEPNVVVITATPGRIGNWGGIDATGVCGGAVVRQPTSIAVSNGSALSFQNESAEQLISAWGAVSVDDSGAPPVLFPGNTEFIPTRAMVWAGDDVQGFAEAFTSCRGCDLSGGVVNDNARSNVAYYGNFSGANLSGATVQAAGSDGANLAGWDFSKANLNNVRGLVRADLGKATLTGADLSGTDLRRARLNNAELSGAKLDKATMDGSTLLEQANLTGADLSGLNLSNGPWLISSELSLANLSGANLQGQNLAGTTLTRASLSGATLTEANLANAMLSGANLEHATLTNTNMTMADLGGADLRGADLTSTSLSWAHLRNANLSGANLNQNQLLGTDLSAANLSGANLSGANLEWSNQAGGGGFLRDANLSDANLSGTNLQYATLTGADLSSTDLTSTQLGGADLSGANLSSANLSGVDLQGYDLHGNNFQNATLTHTNMAGADLTGADLSGTDLTSTPLNGADLSGTNLNGANLSGTTLIGAKLQALNPTSPTPTPLRVNGASFDRAKLRGVRLSGLAFDKPATFSNITIGQDDSGTCTSFINVDLRATNLTLDRLLPGCENSPFVPGSAVRVGTVAAWLQSPQTVTYVNLSKARLVASASDRSALAGLNLTGIDLSGTAFVGWPLNLSGTTFDKANLTSARFDGATFAGASFQNVTAPGASFRGAKLAANGSLKAATFQNGHDSQSPTNLQGADFVGADVSGASFHDADLSSAVFSRALAVRTDFTGVIAKNAVFVGAHIYDDSQAFDQADDLTGADFSGAVLAAESGFDLTHTNLDGAKFDYAQCVGCNFSSSTLNNASFTYAYLVGAVLSGATLSGADMYNAWLYCGDVDNTQCQNKGSSTLSWPLALGSGEVYGPVDFATTNLNGVSLQDVRVCPDGTAGSTEGGCDYRMLPDPNSAPPIPAPCSSASSNACPTTTRTVFDASKLNGKLLSVVPMTAPSWTTTLQDKPGYAIGSADGTLQHVGGGTTRILAGSAGQHCFDATQACGDGKAASAALLGTPDGLAIGLDGSLYIADSTLHRVRRIDPSGIITTLAGSGHACTNPSTSACGNGGLASEAQFVGPYGVWIDPLDGLVIADGKGGLRQIAADGTLSVLAGTDAHDVRSVTGDATGRLYAAALDPDYLIQFDLASKQVSVAVGTGVSGYNSNQDDWGNLSAGTDVQINKPGGLSVDVNGNIMFADSGNNLVRAYVPAYGTVIDDLGGVVPGSQPDGQCAWADQTELNGPTAVASSGGALFVVVDAGTARLLQLGPTPWDESKASCSTPVNAVVSSKLAQATQHTVDGTPSATAHATATPTTHAANATATPTTHAANATATPTTHAANATATPTAHAANATATPLVTPRETPIATATPLVVLPTPTPTR